MSCTIHQEFARKICTLERIPKLMECTIGVGDAESRPLTISGSGRQLCEATCFRSGKPTCCSFSATSKVFKCPMDLLAHRPLVRYYGVNTYQYPTHVCQHTFQVNAVNTALYSGVKSLNQNHARTGHDKKLVPATTENMESKLKSQENRRVTMSMR